MIGLAAVRAGVPGAALAEVTHRAVEQPGESTPAGGDCLGKAVAEFFEAMGQRFLAPPMGAEPGYEIVGHGVVLSGAHSGR